MGGGEGRTWLRRGCSLIQRLQNAACHSLMMWPLTFFDILSAILPFSREGFRRTFSPTSTTPPCRLPTGPGFSLRVGLSLSATALRAFSLSLSSWHSVASGFCSPPRLSCVAFLHHRAGKHNSVISQAPLQPVVPM